MFFISVKKHNRIVNDLHANYIQQIEKLEKENESERYKWLREKSDYTGNLEKKNKLLENDNSKLIAENDLLKKANCELESLKKELKTVKQSNGGLKSSAKRKSEKIKALEKKLKEGKKFKTVQCRSQKGTQMKSKIVLKPQRIIK